VLLAGRGHYDYKDLQGFGGNLLPPMLVATSDGLVPSDNAIVDLDGDGAPDLAVGRLPVLSAAELEDAIDKIIAYEASAGDGWADRVMLAADDADDAGDFAASSDALAQSVPGGLQVEKAYLFEPYTAFQMTLLVKGALDEGTGIVNWVGHAGLDALAAERILTVPDLADLQGSPHPPVFIGLTCLLNNFGFAYFTTLGEELALLPEGGAVAVWAAAGLSENSQAERLGATFMATLDEEGPRRLGDMIRRAIDASAGPGMDREMVNSYVLFADPALELR
jgi:hypothetical protein